MLLWLVSASAILRCGFFFTHGMLVVLIPAGKMCGWCLEFLFGTTVGAEFEGGFEGAGARPAGGRGASSGRGQ